MIGFIVLIQLTLLPMVPATVAFGFYQCPVDVDPLKYYRHPSDCTKFFACPDRRRPLVLQCPSPLKFDPEEVRCNWSDKVDCRTDIEEPVKELDRNQVDESSGGDDAQKMEQMVMKQMIEQQLRKNNYQHKYQPMYDQTEHEQEVYDEDMGQMEGGQAAEDSEYNDQEESHGAQRENEQQHHEQQQHEQQQQHYDQQQHREQQQQVKPHHQHRYQFVEKSKGPHQQQVPQQQEAPQHQEEPQQHEEPKQQQHKHRGTQHYQNYQQHQEPQQHHKAQQHQEQPQNHRPQHYQRPREHQGTQPPHQYQQHHQPEHHQEPQEHQERPQNHRPQQYQKPQEPPQNHRPQQYYEPQQHHEPQQYPRPQQHREPQQHQEPHQHRYSQPYQEQAEEDDDSFDIYQSSDEFKPVKEPVEYDYYPKNHRMATSFEVDESDFNKLREGEQDLRNPDYMDSDVFRTKSSITKRSSEETNNEVESSQGYMTADGEEYLLGANPVSDRPDVKPVHYNYVNFFKYDPKHPSDVSTELQGSIKEAEPLESASLTKDNHLTENKSIAKVDLPARSDPPTEVEPLSEEILLAQPEPEEKVASDANTPQVERRYSVTKSVTTSSGTPVEPYTTDGSKAEEHHEANEINFSQGVIDQSLHLQTPGDSSNEAREATEEDPAENLVLNPTDVSEKVKMGSKSFFHQITHMPRPVQLEVTVPHPRGFSLKSPQSHPVTYYFPTNHRIDHSPIEPQRSIALTDIRRHCYERFKSAMAQNQHESTRIIHLCMKFYSNNSYHVDQMEAKSKAGEVVMAETKKALRSESERSETAKALD